MEGQGGYISRANRLPENHISIELDTKRHVKPEFITALVLALTSELRALGYSGISVVHSGYGSTVAELAVEQAKLDIDRTKLEIAIKRLELGLKASAVLGVLYGAIMIGPKILESEGPIGESVAAIMQDGEASVCTIRSGEEAYSIRRDEISAEKIDNGASRFKANLGQINILEWAGGSLTTGEKPSVKRDIKPDLETALTDEKSDVDNQTSSYDFPDEWLRDWNAEREIIFREGENFKRPSPGMFLHFSGSFRIISGKPAISDDEQTMFLVGLKAPLPIEAKEMVEVSGIIVNRNTKEKSAELHPLTIQGVS